ncbi:MAG: DUF1640 domain-containing protein [Gammaproteobacteria bacterium]|nr:DUF1640 domain-containing protein [Gammaproteobacteria bacterium]MYK29830.1 DUF1640 domain-containing protein [Gammaproteobacteria bacterium]
MASAFDTLQAAKQLEGCGFERQQAEAIAAVVQSVQGDLATKADLAATETALKADFKAELLKMAVAIIGLNAAIMFGLLRLFMGQG